VKSRTIKTSVLKLTVETEDFRQNLTGQSLERVIAGVRNLPVRHNANEISRYSPSETGNELAIVFSDEIKSIQMIIGDMLLGVFLKRRGNNRPLEDDGEGSLVQLTLKDESHEIAEVSYFAIDITSGIIFMTYNPMVGGVNQFVDYLNKKILEARTSNLMEPVPEFATITSRVELHYIAYPESEAVFREKMEKIQSLEFHIASEPEELAKLFLFDDDNRDKQGMRLIREFTKQSNCATISVNITAARPKSVKVKGKKSEKKYAELNKMFLVNFFDSTKSHLKERTDSKFNVKGQVVDEDMKVLDLVHSRLTYPMTVPLPDGADPLASYLSALPSLVRAKIDEARKFYGFETK